MRSVQVTIKKEGEKCSVENNKGVRWEYKLRGEQSTVGDKTALATIAASMLTATITDALTDNDKECKFELTLL